MKVMKSFVPNNFIKSLKEEYDAIPYIQGDQAAKVMVANAIKSTGSAPEDVLSFILSSMGYSCTFSESEWKEVIDSAIKRGDLMGKMLENSKNVLKGKLSNEEMFHFAASCCGVNADSFKAELYLNKVGWKTAIETIIGNNDGIKGVKAKVEKKDAIKEEKKSKNTEKQVKVKPVKEKESFIKSSSKNDSRSIAIIGIKGRVSKEWNSYKACEDETGAGHGTVSQYFSGKVKSVKGWTLYKKGEEPKERKEVKIAKKSSRKMPILQVRINKTGKEKVMGKFNSITEAANATGIKHSSISKAISGTYNTAGGCKWRKAYGEA